MSVEYVVTETITRMKGTITEISFEFEEFNEAHGSFNLGKSHERRSRIFAMHTTRERYNQSFKSSLKLLSFDDFILVLRPFMMGFYENDELEQAFNVLNDDRSGQIDVNEFANFLPIINERVTVDALKTYIKGVNFENTERLTYDEFRTLVLKGVGRDIVCFHI